MHFTTIETGIDQEIACSLLFFENFENCNVGFYNYQCRQRRFKLKKNVIKICPENNVECRMPIINVQCSRPLSMFEM